MGANSYSEHVGGMYWGPKGGSKHNTSQRRRAAHRRVTSGRSMSSTCSVACSNALQQLPQQGSYERLVPAPPGALQGCRQVGAAQLHHQHLGLALHACSGNLADPRSYKQACCHMGRMFQHLAILSAQLGVSSHHFLAHTAGDAISVIYSTSEHQQQFCLVDRWGKDEAATHPGDDLKEGDHIGVLERLQGRDFPHCRFRWMCLP